ncbi:MAG: hypothetical protein PVF68_09920 [Acidobacteriota bacterium]
MIRRCGQILAAVALAGLLTAGCAPAFDEEEACRIAGEHVLQPDDDEWQHRDFDRYPASGYRNVEIVECTDYVSRLDEGWARIRVHGRGDEYDMEQGEFLGRTIFSTEVELEKTPEGWKVLDRRTF